MRRVAIINRGEPAIRLIRSVRDLRHELGEPLETVVFFTTPDRDASFVRAADDAFHLGPATYLDEEGRRKSSYLDYDRLLDALRETAADTVWVGWGFVAEHAEFAERVRQAGLAYVGPTPEAMRLLGDKIGSKRLAEQVGVPVAPWSQGPVTSLGQAREMAEMIGFPLLIKATAGGGGRGIRRVGEPGELEQALHRSRAEALGAFGDDTVFMEKLIQGGRHVEVQVIGDQHGTVWAVGVRDCSAQRRNQKVIEEAPCPALEPQLERELRGHAVRLGRAAGYQNAGTAEFLLVPGSGQLFFMEMNTRLQVEHPVTEATTGLDLVKLQLLVARGMRLEGEPPPTVGHAIEVRINAEDPANDYAPSPGLVELMRIPAGPGVRVDSGVSQGDEVPPEFDSLVAKIIAHGATRAQALARLRRALEETAIVVRGGTTNRTFLLELLQHPDLVAGEIDVQWLDRAWGRGEQARPHALVALLAVALETYNGELELERVRFVSSLARGRLRVREEVGLATELRLSGQAYRLLVHYTGRGRYRIQMSKRLAEVELQRNGAFERTLTWRGQRHRILIYSRGVEHRVEVDGVSHRVTCDDGGVIRASAPGLVLGVHCAVGDTVAAGDRLVTLEAMKMEMPVTATMGGRVKSVRVEVNTQVEAGAPLVQLEATGVEAGGKAERLVLPAAVLRRSSDNIQALFRERCKEAVRELTGMVLGFDVPTREAHRLLREHAAVRDDMEAADEEILELETDLLEAFIDVAAVAGAGNGGGTGSLGVRLAALVTRKDNLSADELAKLEVLLRRYGVQDLEDDEGLPAALLWCAKACARLTEAEPVVEHVLEWHWHHAEVHAGDARFQRVLDRLIDETRERAPGVQSLARQVRHRCYAGPASVETERCHYERMRSLFERMREGHELSDAERRKIVDSPFPLLELINEWCHVGSRSGHAALQLYLRRFYREPTLVGLRDLESAELVGAQARYRNDRGRRIAVVAFCAPLAELRAAVEEALRASAPAEGELVLVDTLLRLDRSVEDDWLRDQVLRQLEGARIPSALDRICVSALEVGGAAHHLTFRWDGGLREEPLYRGIHHMQAERLQLWQLANFEVSPVRSHGNILVFHAIARENPADRRLFAFIDVRDSRARLDEKGNVVELPELERLFGEAADALREARYRGADERLDWNRIYVYPWEPLELDADALDRLARRLAAATRDIGVETLVISGVVTRNSIPETITVTVQDGMVMQLRGDAPRRGHIPPLTDYSRKVLATRRRNMVYPFEIVRLLAPRADGTSVLFSLGEFVEHDLDDEGRLAPVERPYGQNRANVVVGTLTNFTGKHPAGMTRVIILGDPSQGMGALAEPECVRIIAALDLAQQLGVPVEWFPVSSGAKISMTSGTENLDWTARVLRRIVELTDAGGEINVVVNGINVGAQSYWNAEATMLMHTRGILVMTPQGSMVLTGKRALDYSGGVSADDNQGIGGVESVMGPNGQAQYAARDITQACIILFQHYEHTYRAPGERFPRRARTADPFDRDICQAAHEVVDGSDFGTVGEVFSDASNPGRKKPFDIRSVMRAVVDRDRLPLERWGAMKDAETAVVMDAHIGGIPLCLIGVESRLVPRKGFVPGDGPESWTGGTLFPLSSKKVARAIYGASDNRPVVVLANLAGFDGSPESMRKLQLEYGAEIGRAVVRFRGPMVFCVICRYHGGAYVVFSRALNEGLEVAALEGTHASVIGGGPAAAVVFPAEVRARVNAVPEVQELRRLMQSAEEDQKLPLFTRLNALLRELQVEKQREVAEEFDRIHSIARAREVGSLHQILPPSRLRPYLIEALLRGIRRIDPGYPDLD